MGSESKSNLTIRAALKTYVVFGVMFGGLALFGAILDLRSYGSNRFEGSLFFLGILAAYYLWLGFYKLQLIGETLRYRTILGTKNIPIPDIVTIHSSHFVSADAYQSIKISYHNKKDGKKVTTKVVINARVMSVSLIKELLDRLQDMGVHFSK